MITFIRTIFTIALLFYFASCQSVKPDIQFEDCVKLSKSIFCVDPRLDNKRVDLLVSRVSASGSLSLEQKNDLIAYFQSNRKTIISKKEFEVSEAFLAYFKGYTMIHPLDRNELFQKMIQLQKENELLRRNCGNAE
jgi:hypothetical protein